MAKRGRYDWVTDDIFYSKLVELVGETSPRTLLAVPGVYELLSEHFNNEVLDALEDEREGGIEPDVGREEE